MTLIPNLTNRLVTDKKINKETSESSNTTHQMDLTDMYVILYPTTTEYTFFSEAHKTFFKIGNILGHKASLNKC
jgi:hypothetical protein